MIEKRRDLEDDFGNVQYYVVVDWEGKGREGKPKVSEFLTLVSLSVFFFSLPMIQNQRFYLYGSKRKSDPIYSDNRHNSKHHLGIEPFF